MQQTQLDPRLHTGGQTVDGLGPGENSSHRALIGLQQEHMRFLQRMRMIGAGPDFSILEIDAARPEPQDFKIEARAAHLAIENDHLRVEQAALLSQLAARDVELAAKNAEIVILKGLLDSGPDDSELEELPSRRPSRTVRARSRLGTVRRSGPFIHPDDLVMEDE